MLTRIGRVEVEVDKRQEYLSPTVTTLSHLARGVPICRRLVAWGLPQTKKRPINSARSVRSGSGDCFYRIDFSRTGAARIRHYPIFGSAMIEADRLGQLGKQIYHWRAA